MITDQTYLKWQKDLQSRIFYRRFWVLWAIYSVLFVLGVFLYFLATGDFKIISITLAAFVLGRGIVSPIVYFFYKKQRPYQKLNFEIIKSRLFTPSLKRYNSFPSDHSISFAAITTVIVFYFPWLGAAFIIVTILNGIGRVILGYHYAIDILGGWIIGLFSAFIAIYWLAPLLR